MLGVEWPIELILSVASASFKTDPDKSPDPKANQAENRVDILDGERDASCVRSSFSY